MDSVEKTNTSDSSRHVDDSDKSTRNAVKLDPHGLPLQPQPSDFRDDPLNWSRRMKWLVLVQVSFMAFLGPFNAAVPNPSLELLSDFFNVAEATAAYSTSTAIITGGISPFIFIPLSNVYGRRPICLLSILLAVVSHIGSAYTTTLSQLIGCRAVNGLGFGGMMAMGTPMLNDMFFMHERGEMTGIYSIFVTNGAHFAAICGGYLGQNAGWQWDFFLAAIVDSASFLAAVFLLPETLFSHDPAFLRGRSRERSYWQLLADWRGNRIPQRRIQGRDFLTSFYMLKYPSVSFPFWYYLWSWTFVNILPAISMAKIYSSMFGFESGPIGLCVGVPLVIGTLIGELSAGKLSDVIVYHKARQNGGVPKPEHRLYLTGLSALFSPAGMIIFGVCIGKGTSFVPPLVGLSVSVFGLQVASTCLYAYVSDCYRPQTPESAVLMNFARGLSFVVSFFWSPMVDRIGYAWTWSTLGLLLLAFWLPILALMIWGERWRKRLGEPRFHQYT